MFTTYMHPHVGQGRATLAIEHDPKTKATFVGVAYASPKDKFARKKGRLVATGRLLVGSQLSFNFVADPARKLKEQVFEQFVAFTIDNGPRWAAKGCA